MEPFVGQLMLVPFNFAPRNWAFCQGQLLPIAQNTALFSLLGTTYGGDGRSTFALPNLQGTLAVSSGTAPGGGPTYPLGQSAGSASVTLTPATMPAHTHTHMASNASHTLTTPVGNTFGSAPPRSSGGAFAAAPTGANRVNMSPASLGPVGGNQPHPNLMPTIALNYIIALQGVYPSRP